MRFTATSISRSGFGVDTLQSEPIASRAPARSSDPNGYCQSARSGPRNGIVSSSMLRLVAGPQRLGVGDCAERRKPRHVVGMDDLDVRDVRPRVGHAVGRPRRLDRVEGDPDRPIADGVEM